MRFAEDGSGPYVVAITSGAGALASRYGGQAGRALARLHDQLRPEDEPSLISFGVVQEIVPEVIVTVERADLVTMRFEAWCRKHAIGHPCPVLDRARPISSGPAGRSLME
jgi:hypothetical protein